jgi:hypothetical protein
MITIQRQAETLLSQADRAIKMDALNALILRQRRNEYGEAGNKVKESQAQAENQAIMTKAEVRGYHSQFVATMRAFKALHGDEFDWHQVLGAI